MQLLKIEDHASEFNIGDHVIVSDSFVVNSKSLFAVGRIRNLLRDSTTIENGEDDNLRIISGEKWSCAAKISSELSAQLDDLLQNAQKTTDERGEAPKPRSKNSSRRVLVVSKLYSSCLAAHIAMDACKKLPGHIVSHEHGIDQHECFVSSVFDYDPKADPESIKKPFLQFGACSFGWITYDEGPRSDDAKAYVASEIRDAKRRCGDLCVSIDSSLPRLRSEHQQQAIAVTHIYPSYDLALDAAAACVAIPGHLFSNHEQDSLEVTSFYKHNDTHTCRWGGILPNNCSFVYVTRYPAGKNV